MSFQPRISSSSSVGVAKLDASFPITGDTISYIPPSAGWAEIQRQVVSSTVSSVVFSDISSSYNELMIVTSAFAVTTGAQRLEFSANNFTSALTIDWGVLSGGASSSGNTNSIISVSSVTGTNNRIFYCHLLNIGDSSIKCVVGAGGQSPETGNTAGTTNFYGMIQSTSKINAIRYTQSSSSITSGTFVLYGK